MFDKEKEMEYKWLIWEKGELELFLKDLPEDEIFMRPGFEHRLKIVEEKLKEFEK